MCTVTYLRKGKYRVYSEDYGMNEIFDRLGVREALIFLGVERDDIDWMFEEFAYRNHTYADFGVNGKLTFTCPYRLAS